MFGFRLVSTAVLLFSLIGNAMAIDLGISVRELKHQFPGLEGEGIVMRETSLPSEVLQALVPQDEHPEAKQVVYLGTVDEVNEMEAAVTRASFNDINIHQVSSDMCRSERPKINNHATVVFGSALVVGISVGTMIVLTPVGGAAVGAVSSGTAAVLGSALLGMILGSGLFGVALFDWVVCGGREEEGLYF